MLKKLLTVVYMVIGVTIGIFILPELASLFDYTPPDWFHNPITYGLLGLILFMVFFYWTIHYLVNFIETFERSILTHSLSEIMMGAVGMLVGLLLSGLIAFIIGTIGIKIFENTIPIILAVILGYLGLQIGLKKHQEILGIFPQIKPKAQSATKIQEKILDTSVIIDGRILDIINCGFIDGTVVVPQFVLDELQLVADSTDGMKRDRGQRGLELLEQLMDSAHPTRIEEKQFKDKVKEVDQQLILLAKHLNASIMTTDINLNKIAKMKNIKVLNVNDLSKSLKLAVQQGDVFDLYISKVGKEEGQGVGYLEDGTMVVVDDGKKHVNKTMKVEVETILQTSSGRIVFVKIV